MCVCVCVFLTVTVCFSYGGNHSTWDFRASGKNVFGGAVLASQPWLALWDQGGPEPVDRLDSKTRTAHAQARVLSHGAVAQASSGVTPTFPLFFSTAPETHTNGHSTDRCSEEEREAHERRETKEVPCP